MAQELTNRALELVVGTLLILPVCLFNLITSGSCDPEDAQDLATDYNPVRYAAGLIPGYGHIKGGTYTGLWHYIDIGASTNRYNDNRGMFYEEAGPSYPGVMDVAILVGADLSGLSLNVHASDGDDRYGEYDRVGRGDLAWQSVPIGHLEFSPIDNLAVYGWDQYVAGGHTNAAGLGYVLHALGDVSAPHHTTGTSSWGHRPYEDYTAKVEKDLLRFDDAAQRDAIMVDAFHRWQALRANPDIRNYVTQLARETYDSVMGADDWAFEDIASLNYTVPDASGVEESLQVYADNEPEIQALLEQASAATLAFLTYASTLATDPGFDATVDCAAGTHYRARRGCINGPTTDPGPNPPLVLAGVCPTNTSCSGPTGSGGAGPTCTPACSVTNPCDISFVCKANGCCEPDVN